MLVRAANLEFHGGTPKEIVKLLNDYHTFKTSPEFQELQGKIKEGFTNSMDKCIANISKEFEKRPVMNAVANVQAPVTSINSPSEKLSGNVNLGAHRKGKESSTAAAAKNTATSAPVDNASKPPPPIFRQAAEKQAARKSTTTPLSPTTENNAPALGRGSSGRR